MDALLQVNGPKLEKKLLKAGVGDRHPGETWVGLDPQALQTPYSEICAFFEKIGKYDSLDTVVDFGAGYGRVGIVMQAFFPKAKFIGYEIIQERQTLAESLFSWLGLSNCKVLKQDVMASEFNLPKADLYFIYDFSDPVRLKALLVELSNLWGESNFFLVARGKGVRSMIQQKFPEFYRAFGAIHDSNWSLYSSYLDLES